MWAVDALNRAWGNVFWSMEYERFDQIELPNLSVTDPNPAHVLAFRRFSSDRVIRFNRIQCDEIRKHSDAPIIHNFMGRTTGFDHYALSADLDLAGWDSYPLGFLMDRAGASQAEKKRFLRRGLRVRDTATHRFWINYADEPLTCNGRCVEPADVLWEPLCGVRRPG